MLFSIKAAWIRSISVFYTATEADFLQVWMYVMFDLVKAPPSPIPHLNHNTNTLVQQITEVINFEYLSWIPIIIYHMWGIPIPTPHVTFICWLWNTFICWLHFHVLVSWSHRPHTTSNRQPLNISILNHWLCGSTPALIYPIDAPLMNNYNTSLFNNRDGI